MQISVTFSKPRNCDMGSPNRQKSFWIVTQVKQCHVDCSCWFIWVACPSLLPSSLQCPEWLTYRHDHQFHPLSDFCISREDRSHFPSRSTVRTHHIVGLCRGKMSVRYINRPFIKAAKIFVKIIDKKSFLEWNYFAFHKVEHVASKPEH